MVASFTDEDILRLDERYVIANIPFHARPLQAAQEILGEAFIMGVQGNSPVNEICRAYARLVPEVNYTWPGVGTGLVASLDRVKKVTVGVTFGTVQITVDQGLDFSDADEWQTWCRHNQRIAARSSYAFADMHDLVHGINSVESSQSSNTKVFWGLAAEQLRLCAESLSQSGAVSSPILQPICLTAELAMKGTLLHLGVTEADLKNPKLFGHDLIKLGQKITSLCGHRDDDLMLKAVGQFPNYVADRYRETSLSRLEIINLALDAQFIAASAVRRVSGEDLALQMEIYGPGSRSHFFS